MPLLEQQELLEVPAARQIVLPASLRAQAGWYGIDSSTSRYNVAWVDQGGQRQVHSVRLGAATSQEGERLTRFAKQLRSLFHAIFEAGGPVPGVVLVEQASGAHPKPILWYTVGLAAQVAYEVAHERFDFVPCVETVPSSTWKLKAVGRGNIKKPKREKGAPPHELHEYPVWVWARTLGLAETGTWDDADAMGIAECARRTIGIAG